jgi:hypothetical protein
LPEPHSSIFGDLKIFFLNFKDFFRKFLKIEIFLKKSIPKPDEKGFDLNALGKTTEHHTK